MSYALDSAKECEQWINDFRDDAKKNRDKKFQSWIDAKRVGRKFSDSQMDDLDESFRAAVASEQMRCIASDDPRLKEK